MAVPDADYYLNELRTWKERWEATYNREQAALLQVNAMRKIAAELHTLSCVCHGIGDCRACEVYGPVEERTIEKRKDRCGDTKPGAYGVGYGYPLRCTKEKGHAMPHKNEYMNTEWEVQAT